MATTQINGGSQIQANTVTSGQVNSSVIIAAGTNAFSGDQSFGGNKATNVASPVSGTDAANKNYVDNTVQGLSQKPTARAALFTALAANTYNNGASGVGATLTGNANNTQLTIDGVTYVVGDNLLIGGEATAANNGLYTATQIPDASHPYIFTRHVEMDDAVEFSGAFIPVDNEGTANKNSVWLADFHATFTVGTDAVTFTQLNAGTGYTADETTLHLTGTQFSIKSTYAGQSSIVTVGTLTGGATGAGFTVALGTSTITGILGSANGGTANGFTKFSGPASSEKTFTLPNSSTTILTSVKYTVRETPSGTINGSNTAFTLANALIAGTEQLYLNGILQDSGSGNDYTISGQNITMLSAPVSGDKLRCTYIAS